MRLTSKISALAAATVATLSIVSTSTPAAQASSAAMDNCASPAHLYNGDGAGRMKGTYNLKLAPYASCGNVTRLSQGTLVYYQCWKRNSYGNLWWYVRVAGSHTHGWMSSANLAQQRGNLNDHLVNCSSPSASITALHFKGSTH
ncbi:MAG: hypothetical protein JWQ95_1071 [Sphaerisporangium sp.]|jgi:hypothetical protein|nr:hypothetical protein [Sphaerisporangium sp.]